MRKIILMFGVMMVGCSPSITYTGHNIYQINRCSSDPLQCSRLMRTACASGYEVLNASEVKHLDHDPLITCYKE
jgi:hypothetical protein